MLLPYGEEEITKLLPEVSDLDLQTGRSMLEALRSLPDDDVRARMLVVSHRVAPEAAQQLTAPNNVYACPQCGGEDIEGTAWVTMNGDEVQHDEAPTNQYWCPNCENHFEHVCLVAIGDTERRCLHLCGDPVPVFTPKGEAQS